MFARVLAIFVILACSGCFNSYHVVDGVTEAHPNGTPFPGIKTFLASSDGPSSLHVMQIHGMGDQVNYCASSLQKNPDAREKNTNLVLQDKIARDMGLVRVDSDDDYPIDPRTIMVGETKVGSYSTRVFQSPDASKTVYFSCIYWGEASSVAKKVMLGLDDKYHEKNDLSGHMAPINRAGKRFVNRSFSDPVLYVGPFGTLIREGVAKGIVLVNTELLAKREILAKLDANDANVDLTSVIEKEPLIVLSDSLGSRIIFDILRDQAEACKDRQPDDESVDPPVGGCLNKSLVEVFMLANQLPLLELAYLPPPPETMNLSDYLATVHCLKPYVRTASKLAVARDSAFAALSIVAFTDANDLLSYRVSPAYIERCDLDTEEVRLVNVIVPNAKPRWLGVYTSAGKAHASGFKSNDRAIKYIINGNTP